LLPTLGARCGVPSPGKVDGIDLSPVLVDPQLPARPSLMFAYRDVQRAVTDGEWKLIRYPKIHHTQLFNLTRDPSETTNLIDQTQNKDVHSRLWELLKAEMKSNGDNAVLEVDSPGVADWTPPANRRKQ